LAQSQLPKHGHAPRKELIGGGTYLEVEEEIPWGPSRQFPMKGRSSRRKFPKGRTKSEVEVLVGRTVLRKKFIERNLPQGVCSPRSMFPKELQTIGPQGCHPNVSML
jgi:hypothetical protein